MKIQFLGTKVESLSLIVGDSNESILEDDFKLSFENGYSEENDKSFIVRFSVTISSLEESFLLELKYIGFFTTEEAITEEFQKSNFPTVNAPAIAYPFMRSFINTITVNSSLNPVIIPTINFHDLVRSQKEQIK